MWLYVTNDELIKKRKAIHDGAYSYTIYKSSNKNPKQERYCTICGRKLVERVNTVSPYYYTLVKHYYFDVLNIFRVSMCYDIRSCRAELSKQGKYSQ